MKVIVESMDGDKLAPPCEGAEYVVVADGHSMLTDKPFEMKAYVVEIDTLDDLIELCQNHPFVILNVSMDGGLRIRFGPTDEDDYDDEVSEYTNPFDFDQLLRMKDDEPLN